MNYMWDYGESDTLGVENDKWQVGVPSESATKN